MIHAYIVHLNSPIITAKKIRIVIEHFMYVRKLYIYIETVLPVELISSCSFSPINTSEAPIRFELPLFSFRDKTGGVTVTDTKLSVEDGLKENLNAFFRTSQHAHEVGCYRINIMPIG